MFTFGDPQEIANMIFDNASKTMGPGAPKKDLDEMNTSELRTTLTYCRISYVDAVRDGATDEVVERIIAAYDEVFLRLAALSPQFCNIVVDGSHHPLEGFTKEQREKYLALVEQATSAS